MRTNITTKKTLQQTHFSMLTNIKTYTFKAGSLFLEVLFQSTTYICIQAHANIFKLFLFVFPFCHYWNKLKYYLGCYTASETIKLSTANDSQLIRKLCFYYCFLRSLLSSEGRGSQHMTCCSISALAGRQAGWQFCGKSCSCSSLGRALLSAGFWK